MNRTLVLLFVVSATVAPAQEIGTEIPAEQQQQTPPPTEQTPNYDNPYATPTTPPPATAAAKTPEQGAADAGNVPGPRRMAFGLRAGFGGGGIPTITTGAGAVPVGAPTIGLRLFATETLALNIDVGLLMGFGNTVAMGFGAGLGIDAFLGNKSLPVRPFVTGGAAFGRATASLDSNAPLTLAFNVGGGGEYWFNDHFSVNARALIGLPVSISNQGSFVSVATFMPGLGATIYF